MAKRTGVRVVGRVIVQAMTTQHLLDDLDDRPGLALRPRANKVPEVTAFFWITKVLTTGMGETASDLLARVLGPIPAVATGGIALVASLAVQLTVRRHVAWVYWTAVVMVSVFGTMAADVLHVGLGVPYTVSTPAFLAVLAAVFVLWYASERTLSIHSVRTRGARRSTGRPSWPLSPSAPPRAISPPPPASATWARSSSSRSRSACPLWLTASAV
jgi:hypothetical protein